MSVANWDTYQARFQRLKSNGAGMATGLADAIHLHRELIGAVGGPAEHGNSDLQDSPVASLEAKVELIDACLLVGRLALPTDTHPDVIKIASDIEPRVLGDEVEKDVKGQLQDLTAGARNANTRIAEINQRAQMLTRYRRILELATALLDVLAQKNNAGQGGLS